MKVAEGLYKIVYIIERFQRFCKNNNVFFIYI